MRALWDWTEPGTEPGTVTVTSVVLHCAGRKQEIVKLTEQVLTAIATWDFESYTSVSLQSYSLHT